MTKPPRTTERRPETLLKVPAVWAWFIVLLSLVAGAVAAMKAGASDALPLMPIWFQSWEFGLLRCLCRGGLLLGSIGLMLTGQIRFLLQSAVISFMSTCGLAVTYVMLGNVGGLPLQTSWDGLVFGVTLILFGALALVPGAASVARHVINRPAAAGAPPPSVGLWRR